MRTERREFEHLVFGEREKGDIFEKHTLCGRRKQEPLWKDPYLDGKMDGPINLTMSGREYADFQSDSGAERSDMWPRDYDQVIVYGPHPKFRPSYDIRGEEETFQICQKIPHWRRSPSFFPSGKGNENRTSPSSSHWLFLVSHAETGCNLQGPFNA